MGEDDNFWPAGAPTHGPNGVCGPCSEIFYHGAGPKEVEIWNLVFTQFNRVGPGQLEPLPKKNIDTGMGLERAAACLQGVPTVFEIDIFKPIVAAVADALGRQVRPRPSRRRPHPPHGRPRPGLDLLHPRKRPARARKSKATSSAACSAGPCSTPTRWAAASRSSTSSSRSWPRS